MNQSTTAEVCYSWQLRTAHAALDRRDEYALGNIISGVASQAIRKRLNVRRHKRTFPELRRDTHDAIEDAIDALNRLRTELLKTVRD